MQAERKFLGFFKNPATLSQAARGGGEARLPQRDAEVLLVPAEASVHGGEPILLLLPQPHHGDDRPSADCRYCLVFEGSNRRHLASCEFTPAQRGIFSRVPEHDIPERVELSIFADSRRLHSLAFTFTRDPLLSVAADIAEAFPLVPDSLSGLPSGLAAAANTDRRLCAALRKVRSVASAVAGAPDPESEQRTVFHCLAEAGWLESLAHLLNLTGRPEFWLRGQPESAGGPTALQLVRNSRIRSALACTSRLLDWLDQLDGRGSRLQGREEAVVSARCWQTPAGAALVTMTTNKEKTDTLLEQDLSLFPTLEAGHVDDHYLLRSSQTQDPVPEPQPMAPRETACAQTETGRSIEDLLGGPAEQDSPSAVEAAACHGSRHFAETDSLVLGAAGEMSMSHSMSQSMSPSMSPSMSHSMSQSMIQSVNHSMTHSMSHSMVQSALFDSTDEARAQQQQQQQQLATPSRSISTSSLIGDVASLPTALEAAWADDDEAAQPPSQARRRKLNLVATGRQPAEPSQQLAHEQRTRKKRKSFLSRLSGSHRAKGVGKIKGGSRLAVYEHSWSIATNGVCAVCETSDSRVGLLSCRACHLIVHNTEACRSLTVRCLPGFTSCGASATPAAAADSGFVSPTSPGCRSASISGSLLGHLTEVTEEPFRERKQSAGGGNQTLPRNFSNSSQSGGTSPAATGDGPGHDEAGPAQQHQSAISRNMRANSVSNDRQGPSGGADSADGSGATWQASATASLRPMSALPGAGGGGGSAVQQLTEHLSRLSDARLQMLSSESLRRVASWSETQDKRQLKKCAEKQVRRCNFIYELVSTEVSHLRNICVLRAVFRDPLRQFFGGCDIDKLFPHLDELEELHSRLLNDLRECEPPEGRPPADWPGLGRVGAVLRRHLGEPRSRDWLRAYGGFCSEHTLRLQKATAGIAQRWPEFSDLLQQCERSPLAGRKSLQDYYLMLTQRLSKYKTLFPQISEYCQVAPEDKDMPRACQDLDRLLEGVNATVESSHNRHLLERIAVGFQPGAPEQSSLNVEKLMSRSLLHSGHLRLQTSELKSPVLCFAVLLNDMLVFLQELPGGRYVPLACPNQYVPVIHFSETDAIVRENETSKSKVTFFVIIKKPDPALITLTCMSLEERNKWLRRINQVRDSNPRADERALEAERKLREKSKMSAELLASMEAKDSQLRSLLNEKSQLWKQLLGLWSPSETAAALPEDGADPDQLLRQALQELDGLRRLLHSAPSFAAAAAGPEAASGSLTRSASNAEDKAAASVSLPKRADTFSGYDSRQQQRQSASATQEEPLDGSDILLPEQPPPPPPPHPPLTPQPTPAQSKPATAASTSQSVKARRRSVAAVSELSGSREKNRRPSVFELVFKRPQRDAHGSSVSEEDSGGSDPELRQPDAAGLASLDRLHSLVTGLCRDLLAARTRLAEKFKEEARLRQELDSLRAARETEGHRSQDSLLETIRLQRAELEAEKHRFRDSQKRDQARLDTRKEDLERKEEALRQRQEELERQQWSLTEQKRTLQLQFDQYNSMRMQHARTFSDDLAEPPPPPQHQPGRLANPHHQPSPSALVVPTAGGAGGSLTVTSAKGHSKSASNLAATAGQPQVPAHLTSRLIESRQARENGGPSLTSPTLHAAAASSRLSPSPSTASGGGAAAPPQLPLHLASDSKKRKGSSVFKALRRNGESDSAVN